MTPEVTSRSHPGAPERRRRRSGAPSSGGSSSRVERRRKAPHDGARPRPDAVETSHERRPAGAFWKGFAQTLPIAAGLAVLILWVGWLCAEMGSHVHGGLATLETIFAVIAGIVILTGVGAGMAALRRSA